MDGRVGFGTIEGYLKREKEECTKTHEGRRRATKGLEKAPEGFAKGREGEKISTKGNDEPRMDTNEHQ